ncbi:MAG TPA: alpha/beta hydrolase [Pseudolabrys sp.]|nr:alpha/beta hydrolase [Pseudolabrys sp.]
MAASAPASSNNFTSIFTSASDGLQLHARCIGPARTSALPVVCLPGLTRTVNDFDVLAAALAESGRRVIAIDYRGRGLSDYDCNPGNYTPLIELADVVTVLTALGVGRAVFVGTSRGGILTMLAAALHPSIVAAAILNDIGPVIELEGLLRIKSYVGHLPQPKDFGDAAALLHRLFGAQFPRLTETDWLASAHRAFKRDQDGLLVPTYDVELARTLDAVTPDTPLPNLWPQFEALANVPVMVIRGLLSDLLSAQTVEAMRDGHPSLRVVEVPNQGHAPLLADAPTIAQISAFIDAQS